MFAFVPGLVNAKETVILAPDGSKKNCDIADRIANLRDKFVKYIKTFDYEDGSNPFAYIEVGYGEFGQKVLRGNCRDEYE